jgi:hypothetical protein
MAANMKPIRVLALSVLPVFCQSTFGSVSASAQLSWHVAEIADLDGSEDTLARFWFDGVSQTVAIVRYTDPFESLLDGDEFISETETHSASVGLPGVAANSSFQMGVNYASGSTTSNYRNPSFSAYSSDQFVHLTLSPYTMVLIRGSLSVMTSLSDVSKESVDASTFFSVAGQSRFLAKFNENGSEALRFNLIVQNQTGQSESYLMSTIANVNGASVSAVPEPKTYAMMLAGLGVALWSARSRRNSHGLVDSAGGLCSHLSSLRAIY